MPPSADHSWAHPAPRIHRPNLRLMNSSLATAIHRSTVARSASGLGSCTFRRRPESAHEAHPAFRQRHTPRARRRRTDHRVDVTRSSVLALPYDGGRPGALLTLFCPVLHSSGRNEARGTAVERPGPRGRVDVRRGSTSSRFVRREVRLAFTAPRPHRSCEARGRGLRRSRDAAASTSDHDPRREYRRDAKRRPRGPGRLDLIGIGCYTLLACVVIAVPGRRSSAPFPGSAG